MVGVSAGKLRNCEICTVNYEICTPYHEMFTAYVEMSEFALQITKL